MLRRRCIILLGCRETSVPKMRIAIMRWYRPVRVILGDINCINLLKHSDILIKTIQTSI